jgi:hypothetical protein
VKRPAEPTRRGLTFLEFVLALAVTAMIGLAITGMMMAVTTGQRSRRDNRSFVIRTEALKSRLAAYLGPSRCILATDGTNLVLWLNDSRQGETVHASEVRWLIFNAVDGTLEVHYVSFPSDWTEVTRALEDHEFPYNADWFSVYGMYDAAGHIASYPLLDGLQAVSVTTDAPEPVDSRQVVYDLAFVTTTGTPHPQTLSATIFRHLRPVS